MSVKHHKFPGDELNERLNIENDDRNPENGNASHHYRIWHSGSDVLARKTVADIYFQNGPRNDPESYVGCTDAAILAILIDRYEGFQSGSFRCEENQDVLMHLYRALHYMEKRVEDRVERGVLGENKE